MKVLKDKRAYLSGPIEHGDGIDWRVQPKKILTEKFGINLFDPYADPKQQWSPILKQARATKDYVKMAEIAKCFVRKDLCIVDRSDLLIAYLPYSVPTTGTVHEIINSSNAKKPTLLVCPQGKEYVPLWYWGFIPQEEIFGSWDELYEFLEKIENGHFKDNFRWSYIYGLI